MEKRKGNRFIDRTGEKFITNEGYEVEITEYFGRKDCTIRFKSGTILRNRQYSDLKRGAIKNPYHPSTYNIGYLGIGDFISEVYKKPTVEYTTWQCMLRRCYDEKELDKHKTYIGCFVAEEWYCFQTFAQWHKENKKSHMKSWQLDKDILVKGNKIYSPETCCFVPQEVNTLFVKNNINRGKYPIGVSKVGNKFVSFIKTIDKSVYLGTFTTPEEAFEAYKTAKEAHIKEVADKWRELIDPRVYQALYKYEVEITD